MDGSGSSNMSPPNSNTNMAFQVNLNDHQSAPSSPSPSDYDATSKPHIEETMDFFNNNNNSSSFISAPHNNNDFSSMPFKVNVCLVLVSSLI